MAHHGRVQPFGQRLGQAVGQCLEHDGLVVVVFGQKARLVRVDAQTGCHGKDADVIASWLAFLGGVLAAIARRACAGRYRICSIGRRPHKVRQAATGLHLAIHDFLGSLLAQTPPRQYGLVAAFVGVEHDVIAMRLRRVQAQHGVRLQPAPLDQALQHGLAVGEHATRLLAHYRVVQDGRVRARQIPGLKERRPVYERHQRGEIDIAQDTAPQHARTRRVVVNPVYGGAVGAGTLQGPQGRTLLG